VWTGEAGEELRCISSKGVWDNVLLDLRDCIVFPVINPSVIVLGKAKPFI